MDVIDVLRARRSVRSYEDRAVEDDKLARVLEAARIAPSAKNMQEWKFVVVRDAETRAALVPACADQTFVGDAPVAIACCATVTDYAMRCGQLAYPIDVAIAIDHMTLQAAAEGLGTCWIGAFYESQVKQVLGIPEAVRVVQMLVLGYPASPLVPAASSSKKRKKLEEIVCHEQWS
ncbi:MAG TPA: nitroreductase [Planctomycetes bacterium]|nr:nitroreductase [Planctomycetota bacterium]